MKTIWKYELKITDTQEIEVPLGSTILSIGNQNGRLCMWLIIRADGDTPEEMAVENMTINIVGTGHKLSDNIGLFVDTVIIDQFVWHVYQG